MVDRARLGYRHPTYLKKLKMLTKTRTHDYLRFLYPLIVSILVINYGEEFTIFVCHILVRCGSF